MSQKHENRIGNLEQSSPQKRLPWIKLIVDGNKTKEEAFKESAHPGRMEDYNTCVIEIVDQPKITDAGKFKDSLNPVDAN